MRMLIALAIAAALPLAASSQSDIAQNAGSVGPYVVENLGAGVNSEYDDLMGVFSKDDLSLYFMSTRPGGAGGEDLWFSQRTGRDEPFGPPVNLWMLNTPAADRTPTLSRDGHWLIFASNRVGGYGGADLYASYRTQTHDDFGWQAPVNLGAAINSATGDVGPAYLAGEGSRPPRIYFARGAGTQTTDIYVSEQAPDFTWQAAVPVMELNSAYGDANPDIRFDGLVIIFHSTRLPGTEGPFDNWVATRTSPDEPFSTPVRLDDPLNSPYADRDGAFWSKGDRIVFSSDRPGGFGLADLYVGYRLDRKGRPR